MPKSVSEQWLFSRDSIFVSMESAALSRGDGIPSEFFKVSLKDRGSTQEFMRSIGSIRTYLGGQDLGGRTFVCGGCDIGVLWAAPVASWATFVRRPALPELMTTPGPRKSNFLTIRKKSGASSSTARPTSVPKVPRPPPAGVSTGRVPPTDKAGGSGVKVSGSRLPPELPAVQVGPTSGAAMTSADPTRKRKDPTAEGRKDKEGSSSRSASKKARKDKGKEKDRERVLAVPLPGGVFSPDFSMSDRTKFHMSSSQRALIEPLSALELTNAMLEMSTRTSALA
ncbi:hypothetical protein LR48_Vigan09g167500 [Vigna angularis]|uniref:Uncharacterized protein n=1 Tax=Phaseolus angularis TaxID=3914 RepID=A0A0L9VD81_PHAAN|nr:hypothetical protein LR48_Vigan09g167500 [Vigna angularis]